MATSRPQRVHVHCAVQFTHEDGVTGQGTMLNLSMGGCAIQSETPVFEDMLVTLQFAPGPGSVQGAIPVSIEMGRVRWATLHEFGIEFLMILPKERSRLACFLSSVTHSSGESGPAPSAAA